jgi:tetratricopeptide (TPR) repeat protein
MSAASMDVVREQLAAKLQRRHALIDEYERLLSAKNYVALSKFAKRLTPADVTFNTNVAVDDAQRLQQDGLTPEAVSLITEFTRLLPREFAVWNELGRLQALNHDYNAARAAYACSLRLRPRNGSALAALKELSDLKQNSR